MASVAAVMAEPTSASVATGIGGDRLALRRLIIDASPGGQHAPNHVLHRGVAHQASAGRHGGIGGLLQLCQALTDQDAHVAARHPVDEAADALLAPGSRDAGGRLGLKIRDDLVGKGEARLGRALDQRLGQLGTLGLQEALHHLCLGLKQGLVVLQFLLEMSGGQNRWGATRPRLGVWHRCPLKNRRRCRLFGRRMIPSLISRDSSAKAALPAENPTKLLRDYRRVHAIVNRALLGPVLCLLPGLPIGLVLLGSLGCRERRLLEVLGQDGGCTRVVHM